MPESLTKFYIKLLLVKINHVALYVELITIFKLINYIGEDYWTDTLLGSALDFMVLVIGNFLLLLSISLMSKGT